MLISLDDSISLQAEDELTDATTGQLTDDNSDTTAYKPETTNISDGEMEGKIKYNTTFTRQASAVAEKTHVIGYDVTRATPQNHAKSARRSACYALILKVFMFVLLLLLLTSVANYLLMTTDSLIIVTSVMTRLYQNGSKSTTEQFVLILLMSIFLCLRRLITFVDAKKSRVASFHRQRMMSWLLLAMLESIQTLSACMLIWLMLSAINKSGTLWLLQSVTVLPDIVKLISSYRQTKECTVSRRQATGKRIVARFTLFLLVFLTSLRLITGPTSSGYGQIPMSSLDNGTRERDSGAGLDDDVTDTEWAIYRHLLVVMVFLLMNVTSCSLHGIRSQPEVEGSTQIRSQSELGDRTMILLDVCHLCAIVLLPCLARQFSLASFSDHTIRSYLLSGTGSDLACSLVGFTSFVGYFLSVLIYEAYVKNNCSVWSPRLATPLSLCLVFVQWQQGFVSDLGACYVFIWIPLVFCYDIFGNAQTLPGAECSSHDTWLTNQQQHKDVRQEKTSKEFRSHSNHVSSECMAASPSNGYYGNDSTPMIYACATMWHENRNEMMQLLKSVFRMDKDQSARFNAKNVTGCYMYETHIFFDDAFELKHKQVIPNRSVCQLCDVIKEVASSMTSQTMALEGPAKVLTPYGGRLTWKLPGGTKLIVHLKDKEKIRQKKRWSQCMYMYYLLGYRLASLHTNRMFGQQTNSEFLLKDMFGALPPHLYKKAQNTFVLTLDGDVDFKPEAVRLLLEQMQTSDKVASVCGRIHPIGSGPIVWFQQFEYFCRHLAQKAASSLFGCVLYSAGCFSLFRASALLDDKVMRRYSELAEAPREMIKCDQGEDRWLCTLLLQQGHRIKYCAEANALTFAPETSLEMYNQRRRWMPSTLVNVLDLLSNFRRPADADQSVSLSLLCYQLLVFLVYLFGPGFIVLLVAESWRVVFGFDLLLSYGLAVGPVVVFVQVCFVADQDVQVLVGQVLNATFSSLTVAALIRTIGLWVADWLRCSETVSLVAIVVSFLSVAFLHWRGTIRAMPGLTFFCTFIPTYIVLLLYSLCNLNVVSWGTREIGQQQDAIDSDAILPTKGATRRGLFLSRWLGLNRRLLTGSRANRPRQITSAPFDGASKGRDTSDNVTGISKSEGSEKNEGGWLENTTFCPGAVTVLGEMESTFWRSLIRHLLHPIGKNLEKEKKFESELKSLQIKLLVGYVSVNTAWLAAVYHGPSILRYLYELLSQTQFCDIMR